MEKHDSEMTNTPVRETTEDLSFLAATSVLETLAEGTPADEQAANLSETQVFEKLTEPKTPQPEKKEQEKTKGDESRSFRSSALREVLLFFRDLAVCLAAVLLTVNFILRPIQVKGSSMYPTLTNGAVGVSNLLGYRMDGISRFDIVIIYMEDKNEYLVKRCIGLPGETIHAADGIVYINGEPVDQEFLNTEYAETFDGVFMGDFEPVTLGEDEYFCMGDNRPHSTDSRYYGPFSKDMIVSKGVFILFPFSGFGVHTW
ncbi:MAG: signal peptidase I [Erysipelotrichaceae bacterium]|nr:signal peptidase I [Erysipelotrichaceae bacterium]